MSECGASKCVSGASERANGGANGPVLYASISYNFSPLCSARNMLKGGRVKEPEREMWL